MDNNIWDEYKIPFEKRLRRTEIVHNNLMWNITAAVTILYDK